MSVILWGNVVTHMYLGLNAVLRAAGHPRKAMYATILTVTINAILDPLFIFGFGWGIRGAAIATVLAQILALVWQFRIFSDRNELLHFRRGIYRLKGKIVRNVLAIGMSPFLMNLAACFIVILINKGLKEYGGDLNIGAYGIVNRLGFFFVMIVMGINQGMQPIAGYNYGARQFDRVDRVLKLTIIGATCVTTLGFLIGELAPRLAVSVFTDDPELVRLSAEGMRIVFFCFPIIGFQMVTTNFSRVSAWRARRSSFRCRGSCFPDAGSDFPAPHLRRADALGRQLGRMVFDAAVGFPGFAGCRCHAVLPIPEVQGQGRCGERRGFGSRSRKRSQSE